MAHDLTLIGYARVSRDDQDLKLQTDALLKAGVDPNRIYSDKASGAQGTKRPGLESALKDVRAGDTLVAWKLDRIARSVLDLCGVIDMLEKKGGHLRIVTQQFDTGTSAGRLLLNMLGAIAQFERDLIGERTSAGLAAARAQGRVGGRRRIMTDEKIAEARPLARAGYRAGEIAERIGVSKSTVRNHWKAITEGEGVHEE